jgi:hypothetical protein
MRYLLCTVFLFGALMCVAAGCTEDKKSSAPDPAFKDKPPLNQKAPPASPGGGGEEPTTKSKKKTESAAPGSQ